MRYISLIIGFFFLFFCVQETRAGCGSATCPLNTTRSVRPGWLHAGLAYEYINQDRIYTGSSESFIGALPNTHDEVRTINRRVLLTLHHAFSERFELTGELPFIDRNHTHFEEGEREEFDFNGIGDITLLGSYRVYASQPVYGFHVSLIGGARLPSGATHLQTASGEHIEPTLLPGTGSVGGIAGLQLRHEGLALHNMRGEATTFPLTFKATYEMNGTGEDGYRFGNVFLAHLGGDYAFLPRLLFHLQVNAKVQGTAETGTTGEVPANTGGTAVFLSPGATIGVADLFSVYLFTQLPLYQNVNGIQQTAPYHLQLGVTTDINVR